MTGPATSSISLPRRGLIEFGPLLLILLAYMLIGSLYAVNTPWWQVPDEPAHYNYVRQVARNGCCPVMELGDWDSTYLDAIKAARFAPDVVKGHLDTVQYEDWQPPLYYVLATPFYNRQNQGLPTLRLFSVMIGALVIVVAWLVMRTAFPAQLWLAHGVAAFIAFLPQHLAIMAGVSNDGLAEVVVGLILLACILYVDQRIPVWLIGVIMGIGLFTKATTYPMAAVIALAIGLRARAERWSIGQIAQHLFLAFAVALLVGGWWFARNLGTYGGLDFMAQARHDQVVVGQLTTGQYIADHGVLGWIADGVRITFQSFWGQFGWMGVPMTDTIYLALLAFTTFALLGAALAFARRRKSLTRHQWHVLALFGATAILVLAAYLYYNLKYVQFQGRYLFPALIPIAFVFVVGMAGWIDLFISRLKPSLITWARMAAVCALGLGMAGFAVYALYRILIPGLT